MIWIKRALLILLAAAIGVGCGLCLDPILYERQDHSYIREESVDLLASPAGDPTLFNCAYADGQYTVLGGDPNLTVFLPDQRTSVLWFRLSSPAAGDVPVQVFYPDEAYNVSEVNSVRSVIPAGTTEWKLELPEGRYPYLRLDIDGNIGLVSLRGGTETVEVIPYSIEWAKVAIAAALTGVPLAVLMLYLLNMRQLRRLVPALAVCLMAGLLIMLAGWYVQPRNVTYVQGGRSEALELTLANGSNCQLNDHQYTITGGDPQLFFPLWRETTASAVIRLSEPAAFNSQAQLFFIGDSTPLSEFNSVTHVLQKGVSELCFNFTPGNYHTLRFDIDQNVQIDSITVSDLHADVRRVSPPDFRYLPLLTVLLLLVWAVFFVIPAVRNAEKWLARNLIDPETRLLAVDIVYAAFAGVMLLHHFYGALNYNAIENCVVYLRVLSVAFAIVSVILGRMWKDRVFWLVAAFWLLKLGRLYTIDPVLSVDADRYLTTAFYAFFGCWSVGRALRPSFRKPFLQIMCAVAALAATVFSAMGIYTAWTGAVITNPGGETIGVYRNASAHLLYHNVTSGVIVSACMAVSLAGFAAAKQKWARILYTFGGMVIVICTALCSSRTGQLLAAAAVSLMVCVQFYDFMKPRKDPGGVWHLSLVRQTAVLMAFVVLLLGLTFAQPFIVRGFSAIRNRGGLLVSTALAESVVAAPSIRFHGYELAGQGLDSLSSGRIYVWERVWEAVTAHADSLFWGKGVAQPMLSVNALLPHGGQMEHCHNLYVQTFLESGLVGLLLWLAIVGCFVFHAVRLMKNRDLPLWQRVSGVPAIAILISELVEVTTHLYHGYPVMTILYVSMGWTVALSTEKNRALPQKAERPAKYK